MAVVECWWCRAMTAFPEWLEWPQQERLNAKYKTIALCPECLKAWEGDLEDTPTEGFELPPPVSEDET